MGVFKSRGQTANAFLNVVGFVREGVGVGAKKIRLYKTSERIQAAERIGGPVKYTFHVGGCIGLSGTS